MNQVQSSCTRCTVDGRLLCKLHFKLTFSFLSDIRHKTLLYRVESYGISPFDYTITVCIDFCRTASSGQLVQKFSICVLLVSELRNSLDLVY